MQFDSSAAVGTVDHNGEMPGSGGGGRQVDFASDNPMHNMSLAEFTREMKLDADRQQCLVPIVAKLLLQLVDANDKTPLERDHITVFHAQKAPAVSVMDYSERIAKYSSCSYCCFVVGVIYMDRFIQQQRAMRKVSVFTVLRLLCSNAHITCDSKMEVYSVVGCSALVFDGACV